jgi:hypothetical protein
MDENDLFGLLKLWNPWEKDVSTGILRLRYVHPLLDYMERKEILVIKGIRRCGKSTILKQVMAKLVESGVIKNQLLYVNLEDYRLIGNTDLSIFDEILSVYRQHVNQKRKVYFFIDEIQVVKNWEKWIRTMYDQEESIKFIITGSNASLLSKELSTLLTGRNLSFTISPLSYKEFKLFSKGDLDEYLEFGGFPEVVLEKNKEKKTAILQQYFEDILNRDIISRFTIRNAKEFTDLARSIVATSGTKVSLNKLAKVFGLSKDTIATYINYMIDAFILSEVTYFSHSAKIKHDITKLPKLYVRDTGFIHIVSSRKNIGRLYENAVLIKLQEKNREISYWSSLHSEVDFVTEKHAINVTATDNIPEREQKGLQEFTQLNKDFTTFLITKSTNKENIKGIIPFLESENPL